MAPTILVILSCEHDKYVAMILMIEVLSRAVLYKEDIHLQNLYYLFFFDGLKITFRHLIRNLMSQH